MPPSLPCSTTCVFKTVTESSDLARLPSKMGFPLASSNSFHSSALSGFAGAVTSFMFGDLSMLADSKNMYFLSKLLYTPLFAAQSMIKSFII